MFDSLHRSHLIHCHLDGVLFFCVMAGSAITWKNQGKLVFAVIALCNEAQAIA